MRSTSSNGNNTLSVPVYVEKVEKKAGYLLLDFPSAEHFQKFLTETGLELVNEKRSMIEVNGLKFEGNRAPREGSYYQLPEDLLRDTDWAGAYQTINNDGTHSNIISFTLDFSQKGLTVSFAKAVPKKVVFGTMYEEKTGKPTIERIEEFDAIKGWSKDTRLIAMNVGQGNWNEVYFTDGHVLVYDLGASVRYSEKCIKHVIFRSKLMKLLQDDSLPIKCSLIISHWDIDHYQAIFQVEDEWLKKMGKVIYMADPPNLTSQRALEKICRNVPRSNRLEVAPAQREPGKGKSSVLHRIYKNNGVLLLKGTKCSNRNKSGLSLSIWTSGAAAILPADHHYDQVHKYILPEVSENRRVYYIAPHHGGHAGDYKLIKELKHAAEAVLSVGANKWNHPYQHIRIELCSKFRKLVITEMDGDYNEILE